MDTLSRGTRAVLWCLVSSGHQETARHLHDFFLIKLSKFGVYNHRTVSVRLGVLAKVGYAKAVSGGGFSAKKYVPTAKGKKAAKRQGWLDE